VRRRNRGQLSGAAAELAGYAVEYEAAADRGTPGAAERLRAVRSWLAMLRMTGDDPAVGELFLAFARDDRGCLRLRESAAGGSADPYSRYPP
jgi:hypothetical protein